jgi:nitrite reductase (NADH) large subunit
MRRERLVVVGNGMVGLRFLEELEARAPGAFDVTVIGAEPRPAYNRVLLSALLADEVAEEDCRFRERKWYRETGARLIIGAPATAIDREEREVIVGSRTVVPYDRLVLATGSTPIRLPKPGMDLLGVLTFRDLDDVSLMRRASADGTRAVVIGGGLLGLEAAYGLARFGVPTTLVHIMDRLMERQLDAPAAALVAKAMRARGVEIILGADTAAVEGEGKVERVRLADGRTLPAGMVVMAVGVKPNAGLAATAGLTVKRGIVVDDGLTTDDPLIHAIGEACEHRGVAYGLVEPGYEQARVLAARLGGEDVIYAGSRLATRLKVSGVPVFSAGKVESCAASEAVTLIDEAAGRYGRLVVQDDRLVGAILVGDIGASTLCLDLMAKGARLGPARHGVFFGETPKAA